jgi:hypothetical protein
MVWLILLTKDTHPGDPAMVMCELSLLQKLVNRHHEPHCKCNCKEHSHTTHHRGPRPCSHFLLNILMVTSVTKGSRTQKLPKILKIVENILT